MTRILSAFLALLLPAAALAVAPPSDLSGQWTTLSKDARLELPAINAAKARADDPAYKDGMPLRYAVSHEVKGFAASSSGSRGEWSQQANGDWLWRMEVSAPGALSIDVGFSDFRLPSGAALWLIGVGAGNVAGPFTDADNATSGQLWTPRVVGDVARIELRVPANKRDFVTLRLGQVQQAYRDILAADVFSSAKSGSCNVDVACPEGDSWRDQINSVARYTFSGFLCSGQLIASTSLDQDLLHPIFSTAHHCVSNSTDAASMTLYWKYESPTCRAPGSTSSGTSLPTTTAVATQSGATLRATDQDSDFTLVVLNNAVPDAAQAFWSGWDRRTSLAPGGSVAIHHPSGHEKRISINDDPLTTGPNCIIDPGPVDNREANTHWFVNNWEVGTTEGGSSGSGLYDPATGRLIGVLSGGEAACDVLSYDCFGRVASAWDGDGTPATRLKDWLDPGATGLQTLEGHSTCNAPSVSLSSLSFDNPPKAGDTVTLIAIASGGSGGAYVYRWDLDGDGVYERSGSQSQLQVTYPSGGSRQVAVQAADSDGCPKRVSRALDVLSPDVELTPAGAQQVCGNGNSVIDPGERWNLPMSASNNGDAAFGGGYALLVPGAASGGSLPIGPDSFGYAATTSAIGGCGFNFVDIANGSNAVASLPTSVFDGNTYGPLDDARTTDNIALGGSGINLYGQHFSQAVMSTNGYISFNVAEQGGDYSNDCEGVPNNGSVGPRLHVLHDDLVVSTLPGAGLRYRYFASCPRTAESQPTGSGCHVFQWSHMQSYGAGTAGGDFEFQAIVYEGTDQISYQYRTADPENGGGGTIGLVNASPQNGLLNVACNVPNAATANSAVCVFAPSGRPAEESGLRIETPAVSLPALAIGASTQASLNFAVEQDASCGATIAIDLAGTADTNSGVVEHNGQVYSAIIGNGGSCSVVTSCPAQTHDGSDDAYGAFNHPLRSGNGIVGFLYPAHAQSGTYGGLWYTGRPDNTPIWYSTQGEWADGLADITLTRFHNNGTSSALAPVPTSVGHAWLAQPEPGTLVFAWNSSELGTGIEILGNTGFPYSNPNYSQQWYQPSQSGWGFGNTTLALPGTPFFEFTTVFLYDGSGDASWVVGSTDQQNGSMNMSAFMVHCPGCPRISDQLERPLAAGTYSRTYTGPSGATINSAITLPPPMSGTWNRSGLPIVPIATPEQP